jgi:hypothetical protein
MAFCLQKLHFVYKYLSVSYKYCISFYKVASLFTIEYKIFIVNHLFLRLLEILTIYRV